MASIEAEPSSLATNEREGREEEGERTEEIEVEEEPSTNSTIELEPPDNIPTILKKETSPYITIFLGTNFVGILCMCIRPSSFFFYLW